MATMEALRTPEHNMRHVILTAVSLEERTTLENVYRSRLLYVLEG